MSLKRLAISGAKWTGISTSIIVIVQLVRLPILARLLNPSDFGLMGMIMVILGFAQVYTDMGVSNAIIHRQDITRNQLSSLYWLNIVSGIVVLILCLLLTPVFVWIYSDSRLNDLIPWAALTFIIVPFGQQFRILLQKEFEFKPIAFADITGAVVGMVVTVITAWRGFGVLSLIIGHLTGATVRTLIVVYYGITRWVPTFSFQVTDLNYYIGFGLYQMGEKTINYFNSRLDQFLIGVFAGAEALGYYSMAFNLVVMPKDNINPALTRISFPLLSRMQNDPVALKRTFLKCRTIIAMVTFPLLIGLAATAQVFVPLLLGEPWVPSVVFIQILSCVMVLRALGNVSGTLLLAKGRADLSFKWNLGVLLFNAIGITFGVVAYGAEGAAWAALCLVISYYVPGYFALIKPLLGECFLEYSASFLPILLIASLMGVTIFVVSSYLNLEGWFYLMTLVATGAFLFISLLFILQRAVLREIALLLKTR